jgi:lipoprotein-anchoring transpeptidase ErfK/SrfK/uncharacterized protein with PIN domain
VKRSLAVIVAAASLGLLSGAEAAAPKRAPVARAQSVQVSAIQETANLPVLARGARGSAVVRAQILLDRVWFSVGEIDAGFGENMQKAVLAFQKARGLEPTGKIDAATWQALPTGDDHVLTIYTVNEKDVAGPFRKIPADMMDRAKLDRLEYENIAEALAERFHVSPKLLRELNPRKHFEAGDELTVPDVLSPRPEIKPASITILKRERLLQARDREGHVIAQFPVSLGRGKDEIPDGSLRIVSELRDPVFYYDPARIKESKRTHEKAKIPPGPNNPVGVVWLGLSKPHYGIHGTPAPEKVGRTETNGCVHLTNWDALKLAALVKPGFSVEVAG